MWVDVPRRRGNAGGLPSRIPGGRWGMGMLSLRQKEGGQLLGQGRTARGCGFVRADFELSGGWCRQFACEPDEEQLVKFIWNKEKERKIKSHVPSRHLSPSGASYMDLQHQILPPPQFLHSHLQTSPLRLLECP